MSITVTPAATRRPARYPQFANDRRHNRYPTARGARERGEKVRGEKVLFEVPFASAMSDSDLLLLARLSDLTTHMHPKMQPDQNSPGVARLDHFSGLFLERGPVSRRWVLDGRTWGQPAPESEHEWHPLAALAARQLDPTVPVPDRLAAATQSREPADVHPPSSEPLALPRCCLGWVAEQSHAQRRSTPHRP